MNKEELEKIKRWLLDEENRIKKELSKFTVKADNQGKSYVTAFPSYGDDISDNAEEVAVYGNNISLNTVLESSLRDVQEAIARIDQGIYGICKYCGKDIEVERLKARPTSSSCINCKKSFVGKL